MREDTARKQRELWMQCALVRHIRVRLVAGVYWTALPFGEYRPKATGARLKAMGVRPGPSDMLFLKDGLAIALELKVRGGKQSDVQKEFAREWVAAGGRYEIVFSLDEALSLLETLALIKPDKSVRRAPEAKKSQQDLEKLSLIVKNGRGLN